MNKLLSTVAVVALVYSASAANAEEVTAKVKAVSPNQLTITLDNGQTLRVAEGLDVKDLRPGTEVKVTWEPIDGGGNIATEIQPAGASE